MTLSLLSLEDLIRSSRRALVIGVGGGGDVDLEREKFQAQNKK
ncbi:MAG: hypothetical protein AABZ09_05305 [Candidatus Binatota bacterium]